MKRKKEKKKQQGVFCLTFFKKGIIYKDDEMKGYSGVIFI